jgi:hypothetical protein
MNRRNFIKGVVLLGVSIKSNFVSGSIYFKERMNQIVSIDISPESTEGGEIKCYLDAGELVKIEKAQYWESGRNFVTYILNNGRILTVKDRMEEYNVPFYITKELAKQIGSSEHFDSKKSTFISSSYYFKNGCVHHMATNSDNGSCYSDLADATLSFNSELDDINTKLKSNYDIS